MDNNAEIRAIIDKKLKDSAEDILSKLGITPDSAISMFYSQIVLRKGMPFDIKVPPRHLDESQMTQEELKVELVKGIESIERYGTVPAKEVEMKLRRKLGI